MRVLLSLLLPVLLAGCGDGCDELNIFDILFDTEPADCRESEDPRPSDDGKRPGMLIAVHVESGEVLAIRDEHSGSGDVLRQPVAVELAPGGDHAFVADGAAILRVRIPTGETEVLSDATHGAGPGFLTPVGLEWESGVLLVHDQGLDAVIAVDPVTGDRSVSPLAFSPAPAEEERRAFDASLGVEYIVFREIS